jgi:hypothetical protein
MDVLHVTVKHAKFGEGQVTQQENSTLTVAFPKPYGEKKFLYPNAFAKHLSLCDTSLRPEMEKELRSHRMKIAESQERMERAERMARFRADSTAKAKKKPRAKAKKKD